MILSPFDEATPLTSIPILLVRVWAELKTKRHSQAFPSPLEEGKRDLKDQRAVAGKVLHDLLEILPFNHRSTEQKTIVSGIPISFLRKKREGFCPQLIMIEGSQVIRKISHCFPPCCFSLNTLRASIGRNSLLGKR